MKSINPTNEQLIGTFQEYSDQQVVDVLQHVSDAHREWSCSELSARVACLQTLAAVLLKNKQRYAVSMTQEMGKPLSQAIAEIEKCAWVANYYAEHGPAMLEDRMVKTDAEKSIVSFQSLGTILAIMPWNFPFWQVLRFAVPAMLAGNTLVLKHAANVSQCALLIEQLFLEAGFPKNAFRSVLVGHDKTESIIAHDAIKGVMLTGSASAGKVVAQLAGKYLKKSVLELGGSDPYLILDDADLALAATCCVQSRLINTGQSCIAAKRFIVVEQRKDAFIELVMAQFAQQVMGDPMQEQTTLGPLARLDLRDHLHHQVQQSIKLGANCLMGGEIPDGPGAFYPATLLCDVEPGMPAYHEELFGPVAAVIGARDVDHAIDIANDSEFGLGAAVFTRDRALAEHLAKRRLAAGSVFVNDFVKSDPRLPFGGVKNSGYGRELGEFGIHEFVNIKTLSVSQG